MSGVAHRIARLLLQAALDGAKRGFPGGSEVELITVKKGQPAAADGRLEIDDTPLAREHPHEPG